MSIDYDQLLKRHRKKPISLLEDFPIRVNYKLEDIKKLIPHREPFLFLDNILGIDLEKGQIIGSRFISGNDPVFKGHFPEFPVYPGSLQLEMIGQLGLCLHYFVKNNTSQITKEAKPLPIRVSKVLGAYFVEPILPDHTILMVAKKVEFDDIFG